MTKNWLNQYGGKTTVQKFQQGGPMGAPAGGPEGAPAPGEGDPAAEGGAPDIEAMLAEYAQTRDPQLAVAICDTLVEAMMGGAPPEGGAPGGPEGAPTGPPPGGAPVAKNGTQMKRGPIFRN